MKYDFDTPVQRIGTYSMKWDDDDFFKIITPNIRLDKDTIRVNLADMDFRCAPAIAKAMHSVADFENYGYTTATSAPEYIPSIISWYQRRHGIELKKEWIIHSNGALDGVEQTILAFSKPGEGVILCRPIYRNFSSVTEKTGRKIANCQMINHGNGRFEMLSSRNNTDASLWICTPVRGTMMVTRKLSNNAIFSVFFIQSQAPWLREWS